MKYLLFFVLFLTGCDQEPGRHDLPRGVSKFNDGFITCYMYYEHGISCLRNN